MINPQELRIGNWFYSKGLNFVCQISEIRQETVSICGKTLKNELASGLSYSSFDPIPLNEEWLIRLGGKAKRTIGKPFYCYEFERFEVMSDGFNIDCFFHDHMEGTYHITFKKLHIHQLQNLVFALEGVELVTL